jgi:hypothetical protein
MTYPADAFAYESFLIEMNEQSRSRELRHRVEMLVVVHSIAGNW